MTARAQDRNANSPAYIAPASAAPTAPAKPRAAKPAAQNVAVAGAPRTAAPHPAPRPAIEHAATSPGEASAVVGTVAANPARPYYIEFRSRSAQSYGHTFSMSGKMNAQGKILTRKVVGLHPFSESPIPWMVGHLVLVPSETGASDGDLEDQYVTARFRVALTEAEYAKLTAFMKQLQAKSPVWHAVLYNCNAFVGDIARFMGMETPTSTMLYPEEYISGIRDLNINRNTAGMLGTPVKVEDAATLRSIALREKKAGAARPATSSTIGQTSVGQTSARQGAVGSAIDNKSW